MPLKPILFILSTIFLYQCNSEPASKVKTNQTPIATQLVGEPLPATHNLPIDLIQLPAGFEIEVYASGVGNARAMNMSPNGVLYVGSRGEGKVYALVDSDKDGKPERRVIIDDELQMPVGVAYKDGDLYVSEVSRILKYKNIEDYLADPPNPEVVFDQYPTEAHHGWKYIAFGPDGFLYVPVGAPCNICNRPEEIYASLTRLDVNTGEMRVVQHGIRNTVGFDWHPETGELWFTDNGRDNLGDNIPPCEFNHAPDTGMHFGYPFCHGNSVSDPKFGSQADCSEFTPPVQELGPHVAPLGMAFYNGNSFPIEYKHQPFIAEHGSWNRSKKIGYRVTMVSLDQNGNSLGYETFASGWLQPGEEVWGRPVDVINTPDGSLLVSDDMAGAIYRIWYEEE